MMHLTGGAVSLALSAPRRDFYSTVATVLPFLIAVFALESEHFRRFIWRRESSCLAVPVFVVLPIVVVFLALWVIARSVFVLSGSAAHWSDALYGRIAVVGLLVLDGVVVFVHLWIRDVDGSGS